MKNMIISNQRGAMPAWLGIVIVLVVAFLAWLVWMAIKPEGEQVTTPVTTEQPFQKPEPAEVRTLVGQVKSVGVRRFTLNAAAARNYFTSDRQLTIEIDENTVFEVSTPADPKSGMLVKRTKGRFEDLKAGDQVSVTAGENVKDKSEFRAKSVEIIR